MLRRGRRWPIAMLAALFLFQAPLCAAACLLDLDATPAAPPCHGGAAPDAPEDQPAPRDDCGCEAPADLVPAPEGGALVLPVLRAPTLLAAEAYARASCPDPGADVARDLPPPDRLLLASTLRI